MAGLTKLFLGLLAVIVVVLIAVVVFRPRFLEAFRRWSKGANPLLTFVVTMVGLAVLYLSAVEWRVRTLVNDPQFVKRLADEVRNPTLVFDSSGTVHADSGALEYLTEPPTFEPATEAEPPVIVVKPKKHLASAPLIVVLDTFAYDFHAERGDGLEWRFRGESHEGGWVEGAKSPNPRFRLEIIR